MTVFKTLALLTIVAAICACTSQKPSKQLDLLIGTYTGEGSEGIYLASFDEKEGTLGTPKLVASTSNPSFLTISPDRQFVYSVGESGGGTVKAFRWEENKQLTAINEVSTYGKHPCYVDFNADRVAVANYSSGNGGVFATKADGSLKKAPSEYQHYGTGAHKDRQEAPHAHCSRFSKDGKLLYVVDLGVDQIVAYPVSADGKLGTGIAALTAQPGDGPRHLVFHPTKDYVFVVNELSNTVVSASVDPSTGKFTEIDRERTLPEDVPVHSQCADIHISSDGKFLYASNRGFHSIAIYKVGSDATLEFLGTEPTRGDWPRNFALSPDDRFLLVANQNSNNIVVFERDADTGLLTFTGQEVSLSKPVCLKF